MEKQYGNITVLESTGRKDQFGSEYYWCRCACGNFTIFSQEELESGFIKDCGCGGVQAQEKEKQAVNASAADAAAAEKKEAAPRRKKVFVESFASRWCGLDGVATNPKHIRPWPEVKRRRRS
ncbi:hypothetical protein SAMN02910356_00120 [Selenomonas sp. GACV-9]|uniref:hypothetical protein n=1 Tax=Selenomonas sp. GACV-9 TaxID=3158782 RepID=UPI0008E76457|nr:hypothetical protein SAMN02910356_00120 [Selenomonas ruminantium]